MVCSALYLLWADVTTSRTIPVPARLEKLLASDRRITFYAVACRRELPAGHWLRRVNGHLAIRLIEAAHGCSDRAYARRVAASLPFKASEHPNTYGVGLDNAARQLFHGTMDDLTQEQVARLLKYSESPAKHPLANSQTE